MSGTYPAGVSLGGILALVASTALAGPGAQPGWGPWDAHFLLGGPRLGVQVQPMTPELREFFEVTKDGGVLVARVEPGSPAHDGGIQVGDVITGVSDQPVRHPAELVRLVRGAPGDSELEVQVVRRGQSRELQVRLPERANLEALPHGFPALEPLRHPMGRQLRERLRELERRVEELEERG